jgi:predicted nuclease of restriction endonuclease-like (RecB) superfamily
MLPKNSTILFHTAHYLAEQAGQVMKDVYMLHFLGIDKPLHERYLELKMICGN